MVRSPTINTVKRIWQARRLDKKRRGRPRETWDNAMGRILNRRGKT